MPDSTPLAIAEVAGSRRGAAPLSQTPVPTTPPRAASTAAAANDRASLWCVLMMPSLLPAATPPDGGVRTPKRATATWLRWPTVSLGFNGSCAAVANERKAAVLRSRKPRNRQPADALSAWSARANSKVLQAVSRSCGSPPPPCPAHASAIAQVSKRLLAPADEDLGKGSLWKASQNPPAATNESTARRG